MPRVLQVTLIVNCCRLIEQQLQVLLKESRLEEERGGMQPEAVARPVGADEFFPVLVYIVLQVIHLASSTSVRAHASALYDFFGVARAGQPA